MILACSNISKSFDGETILNNCSFHIEEKEKAAIVGINGAGKSTLLKIIMKELNPDSGDVVIGKDKSIGYLAQYQDVKGHNTIYDEMLSVKKYIIDLEEKIHECELSMKSLSGEVLDNAYDTYSRLTHEFELNNGYSYKSEITGVLKGLGFNEDSFQKSIDVLSGGQKTRISLGKLLLSKPDIILLDEPTNHLDINSITWLENYLSSYDGTVIIVAHDRYFLDRIVTKVIEIDNGKATTFSGTYSDYSQKKQMLRDNEIKAYLNQQREIKHQEAVIEKLKSFNREKSIKRAESREKALDKIDRLDKPVVNNSSMKLTLEPRTISGNDVLSVEDLAKSFGNNRLFSNLSFEIKRGERVALIGSNGTGKTTILKIINNLIPADSGKIKIGAKVSIGYYDQEHHVLNNSKSVFDEISDAYPYLTNTEIRNVLAAFLFTGDDVFKLIGDLSGGEKGRVSLAKLMLSESNFLILDEPTNHLDIVSKEILENALNSYTGTIFYVSHDRYFINKTATRILELGAGSITNYVGNYDYYIEKRELLSPLWKNMESVSDISNISTEITNNSSHERTDNSSKISWQAMKEQQAKERKRQNELAKTEEEISVMEKRISFLNNELTKEEIYKSPDKCMEIHKEQETLKNKLSILYEKWEDYI